MINNNLAIKGNKSRGQDVIDILEMLGGKNNILNLNGCNESQFYYIDMDGYIAMGGSSLECNKLTLEEFEEKFPYKVGDEVIVNDCDVYTIRKASWIDNNVVYVIYNDKGVHVNFWYAHELKPHKSKRMKYKVGDKVRIKNEDSDFPWEIIPYCGMKMTISYVYGDYYRMKEDQGEFKWRDDMIEDISIEQPLKINEDFVVYDDKTKKKTAVIDTDDYNSVDEIEVCCNDFNVTIENKDNEQIVRFVRKIIFPKTYEECCKILNVNPEFVVGNLENYSDYQIHDSFIKLKRCRDAYWALIGKHLGIGQPWKPNYGNDCDTKYIITVASNEIYKDVSVIFNYFLIFPTEEIRDNFHTNFISLIETCKELL